MEAMVEALVPPDEHIRLAELRSLGLLDGPPEERFDRVTRLARLLFDVPIALVSLVDEDRQWFASVQGLAVRETPRASSFCAHAILGDDVLHVADATVDSRFADNALVVGDPGIRFYAGAPICGPSGSKLGSLCIIDRHPRGLADTEKAALRDLADMVEREIAALHLAAVDELTGISNRRGFELLATKVLEICKRRDLSSTVAYFDLDGLKAINDELGHNHGDQALREFATLLEGTFRASDIVARLGGDEFVVLLAGATTTAEVVDRLSGTLDARNAESAIAYRLEASVGCATFDPQAPASLASLLREADAAMYQQKDEHRHRRRRDPADHPAAGSGLSSA